jgi:phosphate transport system ATP-binding protein
MDPLMPPPVRRIVREREPTVVSPPPNGSGATTTTSERQDHGPPTNTPLYGERPDEHTPAASDRHAGECVPAFEVQERMRIEGVWLAYGERWVVRDVSLPVRKGEVLGLIGASGSGKTTLLRSLNRLTEITAGAARAGRITLDGQEIGEIEVNSLRRRVSMVFQQPNPFPMSVFENVAYALREEHGERGAKRRKRRSRAELMPAVLDALRRAGLYDEVAGNLDHPALRLSGGQQQRLCIARALAAGPEVLLLDEPCSALDPISTATIEQLIVGLRQSVAIVIVTHNLQQAMRVADHVAFMHLGELVEYGPSSQIFDNPREARTREYVGGAFG